MVPGLSFTKKLYVWSICIEPLLFFVLFTDIFGFLQTQNISRLLQMIVLVALLVRVVIKKIELNIPLDVLASYKYYFYFMLFSLFSSVFGVINGAYSIPSLYFTETLLVSVYRPILEYVIAVYYFLYFVVLARYMIDRPIVLDYFFKIFSGLFYFSLIVGLSDMLLMLMFPEYHGIPRHISDMRAVGFRFHGVAGEPRDAFVYLILGVCMLWLKDLWRGQKRLTSNKILIIFFSVLLTQSASGLIGLVLSVILLAIYYLHNVPIKRLVNNLVLIHLLIVVLVVGVVYSPRVLLYYDAFFEIYNALDRGEDVSSILSVTMNNIYPLWDRWIEILDFNILPSFIGTGLGTSSVINNVYLGQNNVINPNVSLVRTFYDVGVVGMLIFINSFIYPIRRLLAPKEVIVKLLFLMLMLLGIYFAHRSVAPFILLGVILVTIEKKFYPPIILIERKRDRYTNFHESKVISMLQSPA